MNKIYEDKFFNKPQKDRYLKGLEESTYNTYSRVLKRASYLEEQLNKDLFNFNLYEIGQLMKLLSPTTFLSSKSQILTIRRYIRWAIKEDLRADNINPLDAALTDELIQSYVDTSNKYLFSDEEINSFIGRIVNPQDSALIQCLFEGIMGRAYSEILNILEKDVDRGNGYITLRNKPAEGPLETREIEISQKLMNLLYSAAHQTVYYKSNGNESVFIKARDAELIESPYVFRPVALNVKYIDNAPPNLVSRRIKKIAKWFDYPYLTPINIRKSGMLKYANELYRESGKFERTELMKVCRKFDIDYKGVNRLTTDFLNIETIESLYPLIGDEETGE
ncbi:hypothetical protein SAMN04487895_101644 [Paenibacillus sophorae]|uniref:Core-binding (CB) domain-containing protein n=1 Tax=Paenibacillus sophorae TaxID=1333845 RepID=A0A1H8GTQ2_9BACL|nr:site-specific integrase [Paenibacillus sophorae]QWU14342.1 hypothetical protein KP014_20765 [Paenibacillus sophorae]SEN47432.1 hypothetical protein SAMN04487895_101644 [Paenibacillus sophorae]